MIDYTTKEDNDNTLACFVSGVYSIEANITGLTNEDTIQSKLTSVLERAKEIDNSGEQQNV